MNLKLVPKSKTASFHLSELVNISIKMKPYTMERAMMQFSLLTVNLRIKDETDKQSLLFCHNQH